MILDSPQMQRDVEEAFANFDWYALKRYLIPIDDELEREKMAKTLAKWFLARLLDR